ncbi:MULTISPECIES: hypothetical protein [Neisseria]|uniref:hypothetical protein n=1 Tax=Neisseria TaxID=482 RepID=UPI001431959E|nr:MULTISPECIES: hypothetical protein [Neisseria]MBF0803661.1 hypothetical protein [Neisseria sp. 19428wB4_WF04]
MRAALSVLRPEIFGGRPSENCPHTPEHFQTAFAPSVGAAAPLSRCCDNVHSPFA